MSSDDRALAALFVGGLILLLASFWNGGITDSQHVLTVEKAQEMQEARRAFHSLTHEYAHQAEQPQTSNDDNSQFALEQDLQKAEAEFNRLKEEIDAIRDSRPWLTGLLRYGGLCLMIASGALWSLNRITPVSTEDQSELM